MRAAIFALLIGFAATAWAADPWPNVGLPPGVQDFSMGESVTYNGMPMRMRGFVSRTSVADTAEWFRRSWGEHMVENKLGNKLILGRAEGSRYITVQLERAGMGTRAVIGVTDPEAAMANHAKYAQEKSELIARLPAGSQLTGDMQSVDGRRASRHVTLTNRHSVSTNREYFMQMLANEGMRPSRDMPLKEEISQNGETLIFTKPGKEVMAVISRDRDGSTSVVLNTITATEKTP